MRPLAILVTGDPVPKARAVRGSFPDMIRRTVGEAWSGPWLDVDVRYESELPDPSSLAGLLVTGSSASVTEQAPWMRTAEAYLRRSIDLRTPIFGLCFGHQLLGEALGGRVEHNPRGRQIGTVEAELVKPDPLVDGATGPFWVNTTHRDAVLELPPGAELLGRTPRDPNAFVRFGERVWGVQFHPEFDQATMRAYIEERRKVLADEGLSPDELIQNATDAVPGASLLVRFVEQLALP